jgi:hypothetical protein
MERRLPDKASRRVRNHSNAIALITTPNNDTLYSSSFIDMTAGPVTLTIPQVGDRYQSVAIMDMYTNNDTVLGRRTPGGAAGTWRLLAPGTKPAGPRDIVVATPHAWVLARTLVRGPSDLAAAHAVQTQLTLSAPPTPAPLPAQAKRDSPWDVYFRAANTLLKSDPPRFKLGLAAFDQVRAASRTGDFSPASYSPQNAAAIAAGVAQAQALVLNSIHKRDLIGGWSYPPPDLGQFGDHYLLRALVAVGGLAALPPQEAMYMRPQGDSGDGLFHGDGLYRLELTQPIPLDGFWSLTMYEATADGQFFLTENPINRYAIGDRTPGLVRGPNGALDLWISRHDPGGARSPNWLPAPASGPFSVVLRAYLPRPALLTGSYRLPPITPA